MSRLKEDLKEKVKLNHSLKQDDSMVGGLNDEDVLSFRPPFEKRKRGHVNTVSTCHISCIFIWYSLLVGHLYIITSISDSDDSRNESTPACSSNARKARGPTQMNKVCICLSIFLILF